MRDVGTVIEEAWVEGGPFIGDRAVHCRMTVEKNWLLNLASSGIATTDPGKLPFRWWQRIDNSQVETEVPNLFSIETDRALKTDAASATISIDNVEITPGDPRGLRALQGYYTWNFGDRDAAARWGQVANEWQDVLIPNALLRTYQGYGGREKTIAAALADGNLVLTGVWLIDEVRPGTEGKLEFRCRDMAKLLIEQQVFSGLVPGAKYPLNYYRWKVTQITSPAVPNYDSTDPVDQGPGPEGPKFITSIAVSSDGEGYYLVGTDGGVFAFGVPFHGSRGSSEDSAPMMGIASDPLGRGYWLLAADGGVFAFGEVGYHGNATVSPEDTVAIAAHPSGRGYWIVNDQGGVYALGQADYLGGSPAIGGAFVVDIEPTPSGDGYWLLTNVGNIYAYGDAPYLGNATLEGFNAAVGIAAHPDGNGYWIASAEGEVFAFGDAELKVANGEMPEPEELADPIFAIAATPSGNGYLLAGGDGGVFSFGDAPFWGSLPSEFTYETKEDGNYLDYAEIIEDLLRWAGFLAYGDGQDDVYGVIEYTGAYSEDDLPPDLFDKKPVIDPINAIKEIVGYHFWIDEEGAAHFEFPNWYEYGCVDEDGNRVFTLREIDEDRQLTEYSVSYKDTLVRSELIVSSHDPAAGLQTTVTTRRKVTYGDALLRGMVRPAMWVNEWFTKKTEQERMIERILDHITFSLREGTVSCAAHPGIQINDQVRIYEHATAETYVHYIKGIRTSWSRESGEWNMMLTTNWLGEDWVPVPEP